MKENCGDIMRISLDLELKDMPGQLIRALEPISEFGANVISIVHIREEERVRSGKTHVHFVVDVESIDVIEKIATELASRDIKIVKLGEAVRKRRVGVLIIGHVVDTDLRDTIDRINELPGVMVSDMSLSMPKPEKESSALFDIELAEKANQKDVLNRLCEIAREKNLEVIRSLEV